MLLLLTLFATCSLRIKPCLSSCCFSGLRFYDANLIFFLNNTCLATALRILSFRKNHSIWFSRKAARTWALLIVSVRVYNRRRDAIARVSFAVVLFTALRQASDFPSAHTPPFICRVSAYSSLHDPPQFHVLPLNSK